MEEENWMAVLDALIGYQAFCTLHPCTMFEDDKNAFKVDKHDHKDELIYTILNSISGTFALEEPPCTELYHKLMTAAHYLLKKKAVITECGLWNILRCSEYNTSHNQEFFLMLLGHLAAYTSSKCIEKAEAFIRNKKNMTTVFKMRCFRQINDAIYAQEKALLEHKRRFRSSLAYLECNLDFGHIHLSGFMGDLLATKEERAEALASMPIQSITSSE